MSKRLEGRVALVTGASRGLGAAIGELFAGHGGHVILVARTSGGLEEVDDRIQAAGGSATLVPADLTDGAAIDRLGGAIAERWKKLDILVGNAGVLGQMGPLGHTAPKVWDELIAVNLTANWRLIRSLDPLLRASDAGRAIFVSSGATRSLRPYWGPYAASKAGLEALAVIYARETAKTNLKVNVIDPGGMRTQMRATAFPGEDPMTLPTPAEVALMFLDFATPDCQVSGEILSFGAWRDRTDA